MGLSDVGLQLLVAESKIPVSQVVHDQLRVNSVSRA